MIPAAGSRESRITERAHCLRVEFGSCDYLELSETYRSFVEIFLGTRVRCALLHAGDNAPEGHCQLRELLSAVARTTAMPADFKLALVPSTPAIAEVYREAQQTLRALGLNAWVFDTVGDAEEWLAGRAPHGRMVS